MSIKIAAYPKCFEYDIGLHRTMSIFDWISIAKDGLDIDGLELYDKFLTSLDSDYLQEVVEAVMNAGFCIPMFICSPDFAHPDPDERKRAIEYESKMIEVSAFLGGEGVICRVLSGQQHPGVEREQGVHWVVESIRQLIPVAKEHGVILAMENHYKDSQWEYHEFALKKDVFLEIVDAIDNRDNFGVQYDPSNAIVAGDDPIELLNAVRDRIVSMHASDRYFVDDSAWGRKDISKNTIGYTNSLRHSVVGKGLNDYDEIFRILSEVGFNGWVSIEDGLNGISEMQESIEFLRRKIRKYYSS
jgi:sugar phosphate isomerase/epimerase